MVLKILSYNIHKGRAFFTRKKTWAAIHGLLESVHPDIVLMQEFLMEKETEAWLQHSTPLALRYHGIGFNVVAKGGNRYGNLILSRYPILSSFNEDISTSKFERRGLLYAQIEISPTLDPVHIFCSHLDLTQQGRQQQVKKIARIINRVVPWKGTMILGGDFNDWTKTIHPRICSTLGVKEAFDVLTGRLPATAPSVLPLLPLDRLYFKGCRPVSGILLDNPQWGLGSDHLALCAEISFTHHYN